MTRGEAIKAIKAWDFLNNDEKEVIETLIPELKESEDERIREAILNHLKRMWGNSEDDVCGVHVEDAIAWLEKQGEQPFDYENANIQKKDFALKVEPKFKVGDWIANDYCMGKVIELTDDAYLLDTGQGIPFSCEHNAHLWSIEDAKDGDVLQLGLVTAIFEKYIGNGCCTCYCSVWNGEFEIPRKDSSYGCHNATPATKEQRELLFKKMKEAGYKWDADKLIKVPKQKEPEGALKHLLDEQDKFYKEAKIVLEDKDTALAFLRRTGIIDEYGELAEKYRSDHIPTTTISAVNGANSTAITDGNTSVTSKEVEKQYCTGQYEPDVREFPIEWKQENVDELSEFERAMMHIGGSFFGEKAGLDPNNTNDVKEQAKFLLELAPKQEWSEEDEKRIANILSVLSVQVCWDGATGKKMNPYQKEIDWLKSLKERYTWKPSDEQMNAFDAILVYNPPCSNECRNHLITLYNELKKLREE